MKKSISIRQQLLHAASRTSRRSLDNLFSKCVDKFSTVLETKKAHTLRLDFSIKRHAFKGQLVHNKADLQRTRTHYNVSSAITFAHFEGIATPLRNGGGMKSLGIAGYFPVQLH